MTVQTTHSVNYYKTMDRGLVAGLVESSAGEWMMIVSLVFGGCCSYVPSPLTERLDTYPMTNKQERMGTRSCSQGFP